MKKISLWAAVLLLLPIMTGCSEEATEQQQSARYTYDFSAIYLDVNDTVSEIIVEDLDKEHYDADELKQSLQTAVDTYNEENGKTDAVILDKFEYSAKDKKVKVILDYATVDDYRKMNNRTLFIGTVAEAQNAGFTFGDFSDLQNQDEEKSVSAEKLNADSKVVIYEKDEKEDGTSGQQLVTDKYTLLYDCEDVTSEATDRPLRATVVE